MEFFYHIKATQKSGKPDGAIWFSAKTEARADLQLVVALEDAGIETGRGKDYLKPVRTDFPVFNDLPEENTVDFSWSERYQLADDQRTWNVKLKSEDAPQGVTTLVPASTTSAPDLPDSPENTVNATNEPDYWYENGLRVLKNGDEFTRYAVCKMPFRIQLLSQLTVNELRHHVTRGEYAELHAMEMDTDNGYVQDVLLAAESCAEVKAFDTKDLWRYTKAIREVFSMEKRHELGLLLQFTKVWVSTPYIDRGILTREWAAGNRISNVQRTDAGTNADGGYVTDRGDDAQHTLDTLDLEIASALLPMDFNHREIPGSIARRAKAIVANKEEPWKSWSKILRNQPGVLAVNRTAIFNLVRIAPENIHLNPVAHLEFVNRTMTTNFNEATELMPVRAISERQEREDPDATEEPQANVETLVQSGGGNKTDRNPGYTHDFDTLDREIALAIQPVGFNIYDIPGEVHRRSKEIIVAQESPFKEWSEALRATPGVLDYSRAAIFALIRSAHPEHYRQPGRLAGYIHANLTETDHENPTAEMLEAARHTPEVSWENEVNEQIEAEKAELASQPQVANLGGGVFTIDGLMNEKQPQNDDRSSVNEETTSDVQMEETNPAEGESVGAVPAGESADATAAQTNAVAGNICTGCGTEGGGGCPDCGAAVGDATYAVMEADLKEELEPLGAYTSNSETMFTHLMVDLETMGKKPGAPIVSVGAVFFDPASGMTGAEYYQVINLESSMSFGARPDASTILWWLKQSPEARSAIVVDDTVGLVEALEQLLDFIAENAANGSKNVQLWGNGSSFDCSLLEAAFELADTPFPIPHWNYRDVRTVVELGKAVGLNARYDILFEGEQHNALADARHQVKYVSAIWQRLTAI
nr:3'-5' exoribonuclease [Escherichia coli]